MNYSPIPQGYKGVLRWNVSEARWDWKETGPYFRVCVLRNGNWRVNRVYL